MKNIALLVCGLMVAAQCYGQESTAAINTTWKRYASDTNLTYRQMVTICDSMFARAGYPVFPDTSRSGNNDSTRGAEQGESEDGKPLFSVDQNGIYDPTGAPVYDFGGSGANNFDAYQGIVWGGGDGYMQLPNFGGTGYDEYLPGYAISEVCNFPCTNDVSNTSYWVMFRDNTSTLSYGLNPFTFLRALNVNLSSERGNDA